MRFTIVLSFAAGIAAAGVIGLLTSSGGGSGTATAAPPSPVVQAQIINATPIPVTGNVRVSNGQDDPANVIVRNQTPVPVIGQVLVDTQPGDPVESLPSILNESFAHTGITMAAGTTDTITLPAIMAVALVTLESEQKIRVRLMNTAGAVIPIAGVDGGTDVATLTHRVLTGSVMVTCLESVDPCFYALFVGGRSEPS